MSDRHIILDPTGLYDIPCEYIAITTEVEWIKFFGVSNTPCWVRGERLCQWAKVWLRAWNRFEDIREIKQHPGHKLRELFTPVPLPHDWTDQELLTLATELDAYPQNDRIAHFLTDKITEIHGQQIWFAEPSVLHLAAWLAIPVPQKYKLLEQVWQQRFQHHELATYYQTEDKLLLLRRWLGIAEPVFYEIGKYPLPIPDMLTQEFDDYWEQLISRTEGKVIDTLNPAIQVGMERIANCAYKVFYHRPNWINRVRESKVIPYLSHQQRQKFSLNQPPPQPQPLALDATPEQALTWVTKDYLPFRRWEVIQQSSSALTISNRLANSFVEWILEHYPQMQVESVENSYLNYSVASKVKNLCQASPVLWVVVDGLGWLDHLELLSLLTSNYQLAMETAIVPRFSILPTKTEYAKWSLYAQLFPNDSAWVADAGKAFVKMGMGKRYTDQQDEKLYKALRKKTHHLYCWDTNMFDSLYHHQKNWQSFYQVDRPHSLEGIAKKIDYCIQQYPNPDALRIVIASAHGHLMGNWETITYYPPELQPHGRMGIGKTNDPRFVVLPSDRYALPHDISIVKGSGSLRSFSYSSNQKIIGSHGGLFPEEVVVGVSVLRKSIQRLPVEVYCCGEGKPKQAGKLEITIDNPNSVTLTDLCLYIYQLPGFQAGRLLVQEIPANQRYSFDIIMPEVPELPPSHEGNNLSLSGELSFRFSYNEIASATLASESQIIVKQIFSSGLDNIDEFF
ncbi:hypothetical protein [Umezakia ovalisporum]|uniref:hypothetical protein n=1 Tax=Umezakia ovalisporum TaxID=75695 RepID=UPI002474D99B|nr:hypothetical protein [Umezakia ovalisporum]MDH6089453.1 hypothetical protein [Umezakia ovalisporum Ak1311]